MVDLHSDFQDTAESVLAGLKQSYPEAGDVRIELYQPKPGDFSLGNSDTSGVIKLNAYWFGEPRDKFDEAVISGRAGQREDIPKWHGGIGDLDREFDRLIIHEYAHHLLDALGEKANRFARAGFDQAKAAEDTAVSGYASVDYSEWWCDTFAAMRLGGAGSPQVADMIAFLADYTDSRDDAAQYPMKLEIELDTENLRELVEFLKYLRDTAAVGHSFMVGADESPDGHYKMFGSQKVGAVWYIDGDGADRIGRIWINGEEIK